MSGLVAELKRRNIFRVVTVYAVASWVILQLADITFPAMEFAETSIRYVIIALLLGLPIVVGFAWLFEVTLDGLQRSVEVEPEIHHRTDRAKNRFCHHRILSVALLFFINEYFSGDPKRQVADPAPELTGCAR